MKRFMLATVASASFALGIALVSGIGCATPEERSTFEPPDDGGAADVLSFDLEDGDLPCSDLFCRQDKCEDGKKTTVTGTVFDPAGNLPLYNVVVFVPTEPLAPVVHGATCDRCGTVTSGAPLVSALTDAKGRFVLEDVPSGPDVPLVIQIGKWRRQITLPNVTACQNNPIDDMDLTRLPRNQSEGDLPKIAMVTGCDGLECLLRNLGIDDSEFTNPDGPGSVHLYQGKYQSQGGGAFIDENTPPATSFWGDAEALKKYDMVILACECRIYPDDKPEEARAAMREYLNAGGRVFGTHYHHFWFSSGAADLQSTAEWEGTDEQDERRSNTSTYLIDQSFPKGEALADWLLTVGASKTKGQIVLGGGAVNVLDVNPATTQRWIYEPDFDPPSANTKYLSFNTPIGEPPEKQCGRAVFNSLHVSGVQGGGEFPTGCNAQELSSAEKALGFLLFDLAACVQDDRKPPPVPK